MFNIITSDSKNSPIQRLKAAQDTPIEQFSVVVSAKEIEELNDYIKEVVFDPGMVKMQIKKLLVMYVAAVRFVILSFDPCDNECSPELLENCDSIGKTLYTFYNDLNVILTVREVGSVWKAYKKLCFLESHVAPTSHRKLDLSRDRLLYRLERVGHSIKSV